MLNSWPFTPKVVLDIDIAVFIFNHYVPIVPEWYYACIFAITFTFACICITLWPSGMTVWALVIALVICENSISLFMTWELTTTFCTSCAICYSDRYAPQRLFCTHWLIYHPKGMIQAVTNRQIGLKFVPVYSPVGPSLLNGVLAASLRNLSLGSWYLVCFSLFIIWHVGSHILFTGKPNAMMMCVFIPYRTWPLRLIVASRFKVQPLSSYYRPWSSWPIA